MSDGSYFETLQIVYHDAMENFAKVSKLNVGAAILVTGTLTATPQAKQPFEIQAVFRVRSLIAYAIHQFFQERDFVYVHTLIITGSNCEGAGEMFQVTTLDLANPPRLPDGSIDYSKDFFNKPTNLTVSGQLNVETYAMAFRNVYTFGPTFRAENSNTTRHAGFGLGFERAVMYITGMSNIRDVLPFPRTVNNCEL